MLARKQAAWMFLALAATVYTAVFCIARAHAAAVNAGAVGLGAACDLTITVPVLYYLLLVRPGHSSWMALIAVTLTGARLAGFLLSAAEQTYLPPLRWIGVPLEIWVLVNVARGRRYGWATKLAAAEIAVFYYAFAWGARPQSVPGSRAFGLAQASGYGMFSILIVIAVIVEGVPVHMLLSKWSHTAAWILTGVGIYSLLWMVALYRSLALRPVLVGSENVVLQVGFLWRAEFRRDQIRGITHFSATDTDYLSLVVVNEPQWLIELTEPVAVIGPFGRRTTATRIAVAVDDSAGLATALG
ncbi:MAG: hypothetical protein ABSF64_11375 [Bryobacteraceae bacterium]